MIFRHFASGSTASKAGGRHSYLVAPCDEAAAAIINPTPDLVLRYIETLDELGLELAWTLETRATSDGHAAALQLARRTGSMRVLPMVRVDDAGGQGVLQARPGEEIALGRLCLQVIPALSRAPNAVAYRVLNYTFEDRSVLIDFHETSEIPDGEPEQLFEHIRPQHAPLLPAPDDAPIRNFRTKRRDVRIERLILEDLHTSLGEDRFTRKEARVVLACIRYMELNDFAAPSAGELCEQLGQMDRTAIHVLVHNIRWKQIDLDRMPLVLRGQTSKWLRSLQSEPEFTAHEKEFLRVYLRMVKGSLTPPTGPDIAEALGERSVQWVRKRAHTIRRKQRAFGQPELQLARKGSPKTEEACSSSDTPGPRQRVAGQRELHRFA